MGSEGYFINQFLVSHTNKRNDDWGGSWPNRMRLPVEIVTRMREAVGKDFIIVYRLSMLDLIPDGQRSEEHTSELQSLMRISYAVFCLKKKHITLLLFTYLFLSFFFISI